MRIIITILLLLTCSTSLYAAVTSLYQTEVAVSSQSDDERVRAVKEGLTHVLVKLTGNAQIDANKTIKAALEKADYYVQEYSYSTPDVSSYHYSLVITYDTNDVNNLLKKAGFTYWGGERPSLLVWLLVDQEGQTEIISNESMGEILPQIKQLGVQYGLPLIFPMMDVADMSQVSSDAINTMNISLLEEAAKRYAPQGLLIGRIKQRDKQWLSDWQLIIAKSTWNFKMTGQSANSIVTDVLKNINQILAKQNTVKKNDEPLIWLQLEITHVLKPEDLNSLMQSLKQLNLVQQVKLSQIVGDRIDLAIEIRGSSSSFLQSTQTIQKLLFVSQENNNQLKYEWVQ
jgi:hypothetical protein